MKKKISGILFIIFGIFGALAFEKYALNRPFSIDRMLFYIYGIIFIGLNILLDVKKMWNFIYKKRYIIGGILFTYVVLMGYNGSSMFAYNEVIEPDYITKEMVPIWGISRSIRSDEYFVDTPAILSQYLRNKDFSIYNNAIMGRDSVITMFPHLPNKSISILANIRMIGFLIFNLEQAYSFYWYLPYFVLFFALFEMFMILTKKNKLLSLTGTIMLEFSPSLLWWNSTPFLMYGSLATIFFYHIFHSEQKWKKILFSILLGWAGASYVMIMYPAWMVPYGYLFLILFIYCFILNKEKLNWKDFLYLFISIFVMSLILIPTFISSKDVLKAMLSTEYPGARSSIGGSGSNYFYYYFSSIFYPIFNVGNPCEYSQYLSFYPLPIFLSIFYLIKRKKEIKKHLLLLFLTILAILLSIWNYIPIGVFAKLSLLSMSIPERTQVVVSVICVFIIIIIMNDFVSKNIHKKKIIAFIASFIFCSIGLSIVKTYLNNYMDLDKLIISFILFSFLAYLLIINTKKSVFIFSMFMNILGIVMFLTIHPINKNLDTIMEKPLSNEIKKIELKNKESLWIALNSPIHLQNFALANGARVINSTNYYPNLNLWKELDTESLYNEIYNRYAHIVIEITKENTKFELLSTDLFKLKINKKDICKLNANYIISSAMLENDLDNIELIYNYSNIRIYQLNC